MKPTLDLYIGRYVAAIVHGDYDWQWGIRLDSGVEIRNKDRRETFHPDRMKVIGARIQTIMMSLQDTTIQFSNGEKWGLNPTQYVIHDPKHGGEVYPQWPEELEEAGITSHPDEEASAKADDGWTAEEKRLVREQRARHQSEAVEFLKEDDDES